MADLVTEFTTRNQARLVALTNPANSKATTVNTVTLAAAAKDVNGEFLLWMGFPFDGSKDDHVSVGCRGMLLFLRSYQGQVLDKDLDAWRDGLKQGMAQAAWIQPTSSSELTPSSDVENHGSPARPDWDDQKFRPYQYRDRQGGGAGLPFDNS